MSQVNRTPQHEKKERIRRTYDPKRLASYLRNEFKEYIRSNPAIKSVVLGLSGGIDSAIVAALVQPTCKELGINLIGVSIPSSTNKIEEIKRASACGMFCSEFHEILIETYSDPLLRLIGGSHPANITDKAVRIRIGNIKARVRMIILYDFAQKNNGMVLSTDNYTELMLGFWTLHGDVGDYGLIQNLWKTEVYELALYIAKEELKDSLACTLQACIDATPTDGNGVSSSDLEQIGVPTYKEADDILWNHIHNTNKFPKDHVVIQRHLRTEFKRKNPTNVDLIQYWTEGER